MAFKTDESTLCGVQFPYIYLFCSSTTATKILEEHSESTDVHQAAHFLTYCDIHRKKTCVFMYGEQVFQGPFFPLMEVVELKNNCTVAAVFGLQSLEAPRSKSRWNPQH